jgi:hypothetical protein
MAIKRFDETRKSFDPLMDYRSIISVFVTQGNTVKDYDIRERREQSAQSSNQGDAANGGPALRFTF